MNDIARPVYLPGAGADGVSLGIDFDQAGRGNLVEHEAEGIEQEMPVGSRKARRDMGVDQIGHGVFMHQPVTGREIGPDATLFGLLRRHADGCGNGHPLSPCQMGA